MLAVQSLFELDQFQERLDSTAALARTSFHVLCEVQHLLSDISSPRLLGPLVARPCFLTNHRTIASI